MRRGRKPRTEPKEVAVERETFIWQLRVTEKKTLAQIARAYEEKYGESISEAQVSRLIKKAREEYVGKKQELIEQLHVELDMLLDWTIQQAKLGWERSLTDRVKKTVSNEEGTDPKTGNPYNKSIEGTETEGQAGEPRFLKNIIDAAARKSKLWGLDAPPKTAQTPDDDPDPKGMEPWKALADVIRESERRLQREDEDSDEGGNGETAV